MENNKGRKKGGLRLHNIQKQSQKNEPLITVITVVYDGEKYLEKTIQSVINQTYKNLEYIIIDGGSTDATIDIIKKYESQIDYWISESDAGIYDAMNKGVLLARGEYIGIINADDWYELNTIEIIVNTIIKDDSLDILFGDRNIIKADNLRKLGVADLKKIKYRMSINHPTCFIKKNLYSEKMFDTNYKIAADYDLLLYFYIYKKNFFNTCEILTNVRLGGVSDASSQLTLKERFSIHIKYYSRCHAYFCLYRSKVKEIIKLVLKFLLPHKLFYKIKGYN